ncbi:flavin reductase [Nocardia sp. NPDC001965]
MGFTLNVPAPSHPDAVWKLGAKYSRFPVRSPAEKLRASGIELDLDESGYGPVVPTGIGWATCRTIARIDLFGNHGIFVGEVEDAWFNPEFLRPDGTPAGPAKPVVQQTGNLFTTVAEELSTMEYFQE